MKILRLNSIVSCLSGLSYYDYPVGRPRVLQDQAHHQRPYFKWFYQVYYLGDFKFPFFGSSLFSPSSGSQRECNRVDCAFFLLAQFALPLSLLVGLLWRNTLKPVICCVRASSTYSLRQYMKLYESRHTHMEAHRDALTLRGKGLCCFVVSLQAPDILFCP